MNWSIPMRTLEEIGAILAQRMEHEEICDLLNISTEELLERFEDKIADKYDELNEEIEDA